MNDKELEERYPVSYPDERIIKEEQLSIRRESIAQIYLK